MDNFFAKMFQKREATPACDSESKPSYATGGSFKGQTVQIGSPQSALTVPAWYRASDVLATTMSMMVMEFQKRNKSCGGNYELYDGGIMDGARLNFLLQVQPNPLMTASQFWAQMTLARMNEGNAVAYIERDEADEIKYIWLCNSASLNPITLTYTISWNGFGGVRTLAEVDAKDVIHWRNTFSNDHGLTGISTLRYAIKALTTAATNDNQAKDIASKGGKHKILLSEKDQPGGMDVLNLLNKDQKLKQQEDLQTALDEGKDVILMSGMMSAQVISQDAQAQQLLESRKFDITAVARFTGVPLVLLMDYSNNTYKAPEQAMQAFLQHTISPMANSLEMEINAKVLGQKLYGPFRFHFNDSSLLRLDPIGKANLMKVLTEIGVHCVNENRAEYDLPKIEGGDRHFISTNLQPVDAPTVGQNQNQSEPNGTNKNQEEGGEP